MAKQIKDNNTVWQRLTYVFDKNSTLQGKNIKSYSYEKDELLKTTDRTEYEREKLERQQTSYLSNQWKKVESNLYTQAVYYEPTRLAAFYDFESMEYTPEISAALDIYSEEATTTDENGNILTIYSESKRVKSVLEDLFYNRIDINTNLPMWTRNTCKYGDNFVYLKLDNKEGIKNVMQLPNIEIVRKEVGMNIKPERNTSSTSNDSLKFLWQNKNLEFNTWEIAHFRLLGDDRKLPYGTSALEKARRIWKQLVLAEDAMLIYRTSRAPERRIFKIYVGNMDDKDVDPYVQKMANNFKRDQIVDKDNGNVDLRYNQMAVDQDYFVPVRDPNAPSPIDTLPGACVSLDTKIPLLDGRSISLSEIIKEWDGGNRNLWAYSTDPKTGKISPGLITWAGVTRKNADVVKITLDNGESLITTPDHNWVHRTDGFIEAKDLKIGDSLMPFYTRNKKISNSELEYKQTWDNDLSEWVYDHRMVANFFKEKDLHNEFVYNNRFELSEKNTIHHIDINRFNNTPNNLCFMNDEDHYIYHSENFGELSNVKEREKSKKVNYNHKIVSIEYLNKKMDTGTITIDGNEILHDYHTFATEAGVFIKNSNLGEISDIEYIQKKLLATLRVPKAFLGFEEVVGEGKNLAIQDIRFARTINRIQQSMIQELNKIAIIHLYLLGFEDDLNNFNLTLTNPSTQGELLKLEEWTSKITLYRDAVADPGDGIKPVSATWAKKHILGFTDEDIKLDIQRQRIEKAVGAEIENTPNIITKTGIFDTLDKLYANKEALKKQEEGELEPVSDEDDEFGGDEFGDDFSGEFDDVDTTETIEDSVDKIEGLSLLFEDNKPVVDIDNKKISKIFKNINKDIDNMLKE